jgi:hypothetical protein
MVVMVSSAHRGVQIRRAGASLLLETSSYSLVIADTADGFGLAPYASVFDAEGALWTRLALLSQVDSTETADETWSFGGVLVDAQPECVDVSIELRSAAWDSKRIVLRCTEVDFSVRTEVVGTGHLTDVTLLGGHAFLANGASGTFRSSTDFLSVFSPSPSEPVAFLRPANASAALGVVGDADAGRLNAVFSPPPLALGFGRAEPSVSSAAVVAALEDGDWLGVSVRAAVAELTFTALRYEPLDGGFVVRLAFEGHTRVEGKWSSPTLVFRIAASGWAVLANHRADLVEHGFAPVTTHQPAAWWREPIFCGWGAQCARFVKQHGRGRKRHGRLLPDALDEPAGEPVSQAPAIVLGAMGLARQDVYDEFLQVLDDNDLEPGTIVIDDRWQAAYGTVEPDLEHWPDLRGWIARQHATGRRVLLWWKAWDPQGIPPDECIIDAGGRAISVNPASDAYRRRLRSIVERLLGPDGLDADGFKIDFTQRAPSGRSLIFGAAEQGSETWGVAALHELLHTIYTAAKHTKSDALVITHAIHPSFADVSDMVRLNDVLEEDVAGTPVPVADQLRMRAAIASHTLPDHLIDTDQWPMPNKAEWLSYVDAQADLGVPALYYLESIDNSGEPIDAADLAVVRSSWERYREGMPR